MVKNNDFFNSPSTPFSCFHLFKSTFLQELSSLKNKWRFPLSFWGNKTPTFHRGVSAWCRFLSRHFSSHELFKVERSDKLKMETERREILRLIWSSRWSHLHLGPTLKRTNVESRINCWILKKTLNHLTMLWLFIM